MLKKLLNKNKKSPLEKIIFALEKLTNIASVKAISGDNERVKEIIIGIERLFLKFYSLKKKDSGKYDSLLEQSDFYESKIKIDLGFNDEIVKKEDSDVGLKELFDTDEGQQKFIKQSRELKITGRFINSFGKIWASANEKGNEEVTGYVVFHLEYILAEISKDEGNENQVSQLLDAFENLTWEIVSKNDRKRIDRSIYPAAICWYPNIVFNRLRADSREFKLNYLASFERKFFSIARYIVREGEFELFKSWVSFLTDGILISSIRDNRIWDYGNLIPRADFERYKLIEDKHDIDKKIRLLVSDTKTITDQNELKSWLDKFYELKEILIKYFNEKEKKEADKLEREIVDSVNSQYKYGGLEEIVFSIGAYCIFKKRFNFIKYLWNFAQPDDSDAVWIRGNLVSNSIKGNLRFYGYNSMHNQKFAFWEDHHGSELYSKKYLLLLFIYVLKGYKANEEGKYSEIENFALPKYGARKLNDIRYETDSYIVIAENLLNERKLLKELGFPEDEIEGLINVRLLPLLNRIKENALEKLNQLEEEQEPSLGKIEEFKEKVLSSYIKSRTVKNVFDHYKLFKDCSDKVKEDGGRRGINVATDKTPFFDEWYVHYSDWGEGYGRSLATGEDESLIETIISECSKEKELYAALAKLDNVSNAIIFLTNIDVYNALKHDKSFINKWDKDCEGVDVDEFEGYLIYKKHRIPVFQTYRRRKERGFLILDVSKLGEIKQYSPLKAGEPEKFRKEMLYMNIQAYSRNSEMLNEILSKPPEWLSKIGDKEDQKNYLRRKASVLIMKNVHFEKYSNFQGYYVSIENYEKDE